MNKNTILILCFLGDPLLPSGSLSGTGGYNASAKDIFDYLIKTPQFDSIFITNTTGNYSNETTTHMSSNVTLYRIFSPAINIIHKNNYIQEISVFKKRVEEIVEDFSNISFIHSFYWLSGMVATELSEKYHVPFIHTTVSLSKQKLLSGCQPEIKNQFEMESHFLSQAKYILAITEEEKRILTDYYYIKKEKIVVEGQNIAREFHEPLYNNYGIPHNIEFDKKLIEPIGFDKLDVSNDDWWNMGAFTYVGRITKTKGLDIIIKAWIELDNMFDKPIPPLWIIGNTPYEIEHFRKSIDIPLSVLNNYEHSKRIVWWGYLTPAGISTLFLKTAVLVTHSIFEGGGRVILEAMCQGIPIISTNTGFGKDYITNWINGFIVNYGDIETLRLRMSHFITNPILSSVLGQNAQHVFEKIETDLNHNKIIEKIYGSIINQCEFSNSDISNLNINENVFYRGIVATYPYYYHKPSPAEIANFINNIISERPQPYIA